MSFLQTKENFFEDLCAGDTGKLFLHSIETLQELTFKECVRILYALKSYFKCYYICTNLDKERLS